MATLAHQSGDVSDPTNDSPADRMIQRDTGLQEITTKFENDFSIEPDADLNLDLSDSTPRDSDTASNSSSFREVDENLEDNSDDSTKPKKNINNGVKPKSLKDSSSLRSAEEEPDADLKSEVKGSKKKKAKDNSKTASDAESLGSKKESSTSSKSKNPLKLLKRLTKFDKSSKRKSSFKSEFATIVVDKLPQVFVVKYLGHREVPGVSGLQHIRKPVDEMVQQVRAKFDAKEEVRLPLLYVVVSEKGLELREHQSNKEKGTAPLGLMPIDFISYGVQDIKYWKVFTCIVVRSLSWQMRSATCHAFFCDSPHSGRKMALSLGAAFNVYAKKLKADGKSHNFQVELRPPDEIVDEISECDA